MSEIIWCCYLRSHLLENTSQKNNFTSHASDYYCGTKPSCVWVYLYIVFFLSVSRLSLRLFLKVTMGMMTRNAHTKQQEVFILNRLLKKDISDNTSKTLFSIGSDTKQTLTHVVLTHIEVTMRLINGDDMTWYMYMYNTTERAENALYTQRHIQCNRSRDLALKLFLKKYIWSG